MIVTDVSDTIHADSLALFALNIEILLADVTKSEKSKILTLTWPVTSSVTSGSNFWPCTGSSRTGLSNGVWNLEIGPVVWEISGGPFAPPPQQDVLLTRPQRGEGYCTRSPVVNGKYKILICSETLKTQDLKFLIFARPWKPRTLKFGYVVKPWKSRTQNLKILMSRTFKSLDPTPFNPRPLGGYFEPPSRFLAISSKLMQVSPPNLQYPLSQHFYTVCKNFKVQGIIVRPQMTSEWRHVPPISSENKGLRESPPRVQFLSNNQFSYMKWRRK